mgnify:CR=1 FL=1
MGGERIDAAIAELDMQKRKVSLSIKLLEELQNKEARRQFLLDDALAKLFKLKKNESMEYFKLQTHMKQHFPKAVAAK